MAALKPRNRSVEGGQMAVKYRRKGKNKHNPQMAIDRASRKPLMYSRILSVEMTVTEKIWVNREVKVGNRERVHQTPLMQLGSEELVIVSLLEIR